jgi:hypothetical protein
MNDINSYFSERLDHVDTLTKKYMRLADEHASLREKYARLARIKQHFVWWTMAGWAAFGIAVARLIYLGVR